MVKFSSFFVAKVHTRSSGSISVQHMMVPARGDCAETRRTINQNSCNNLTICFKTLHSPSPCPRNSMLDRGVFMLSVDTSICAKTAHACNGTQVKVASLAQCESCGLAWLPCSPPNLAIGRARPTAVRTRDENVYR